MINNLEASTPNETPSDPFALENIRPENIESVEDRSADNAVIITILKNTQDQVVHAGRILARTLNRQVSKFPYPNSFWRDPNAISDTRLDTAQFSYVEQRGDDSKHVRCLFMLRDANGNDPYFADMRAKLEDLLTQVRSNESKEA